MSWPRISAAAAVVGAGLGTGAAAATGAGTASRGSAAGAGSVEEDTSNGIQDFVIHGDVVVYCIIKISCDAIISGVIQKS